METLAGRTGASVVGIGLGAVVAAAVALGALGVQLLLPAPAGRDATQSGRDTTPVIVAAAPPGGAPRVRQDAPPVPPSGATSALGPAAPGAAPVPGRLQGSERDGGTGRRGVTRRTPEQAQSRGRRGRAKSPGDKPAAASDDGREGRVEARGNKPSARWGERRQPAGATGRDHSARSSRPPQNDARGRASRGSARRSAGGFRGAGASRSRHEGRGRTAGAGNEHDRRRGRKR